MSNKHDYFIREYETLTNKLLKINQIEIGDVGCIVWDAAIVLAKFLEKSIQNKKLIINESQKYLELGAGTGIVGLVLASYGASVTLTDLDEVVDLLNKNLDENKSLIDSNCRVKELNWLNFNEINKQFDKQNFIILADCVYYEQSCEPLIQCLVNLSDFDTIIYFSYEKRDLGKVPEIQKKFFNLASQYFDMNLVSNDDLDEFYRSDDIQVYEMKLKVPN